MQITNNDREVQSVTLDGITWVLSPGVSVTISKTERIVAFTEDHIQLLDKAPSPSKQCRFRWPHDHNDRSRLQRQCIRHQGHDHAHSDVLGFVPTPAEWTAAKAGDAKDC